LDEKPAEHPSNKTAKLFENCVKVNSGVEQRKPPDTKQGEICLFLAPISNQITLAGRVERKSGEER